MPGILRDVMFMLPFVIVEVIGIILALTRWQKHPRASMFATLGFGLSLVSTVFFSVVQRLVLDSRTGGDIGTILTVIGLFRTACSVTAYGLLIGAIFSDRQPSKPMAAAAPRRSRYRDDDFEDRPRRIDPVDDAPRSEGFREGSN